ncbi:hypothetical protein QBC39DRAFT_402393, partial [Podospora conica]
MPVDTKLLTCPYPQECHRINTCNPNQLQPQKQSCKPKSYKSVPPPSLAPVIPPAPPPTTTRTRTSSRFLLLQLAPNPRRHRLPVRPPPGRTLPLLPRRGRLVRLARRHLLESVPLSRGLHRTPHVERHRLLVLPPLGRRLDLLPGQGAVPGLPLLGSRRRLRTLAVLRRGGEGQCGSRGSGGGRGGGGRGHSRGGCSGRGDDGH